MKDSEKLTLQLMKPPAVVRFTASINVSKWLVPQMLAPGSDQRDLLTSPASPGMNKEGLKLQLLFL